MNDHKLNDFNLALWNVESEGEDALDKSLDVLFDAYYDAVWFLIDENSAQDPMELISYVYGANCNDVNKDHTLPFAKEVYGLQPATEFFLQLLISISPSDVPEALATVF